MDGAMSERTFWMIGADGQVYGPNDAATLHRWITEARLTPHTQVATGPDGPWRPAMDFVELAAHFPPQPRTGGMAEGAGAASAGVGSGAGDWTGGGDHGSGSAPGDSPGAPPTSPSATSFEPRGEWPPTSLQVPLLIGAIFNMLHGIGGTLALSFLGVGTFGLGWCCCPFGLIPLIVGVLQVMDFSKASRTEPQRYFDRTQVWGIVNIVMVLFAGLVPLICGILQLAFLGDARRKHGGR